MAASSPANGLPTPVAFYFDPACPWTYRVSQWLREARQVRPIDVSWKFLSLYEINHPSGNVRDTHVQSYATFPVLMLVRERYGNEAVDRLYAALGRSRHEAGHFFNEPGVIEAALQEAGLDPALKDEAAADSGLEQKMLAEHRDAVERLGAQAVPTLSIDGDRAIFGPVIGSVPTGTEAGEFWDHFVWLAGREDFYEFKKSRP